MAAGIVVSTASLQNRLPAFRRSGFPAFRLSGFPAFRQSSKCLVGSLVGQALFVKGSF